ncbi:hypothetical protein HN51_044969 [Arachis hypogaea]
MPGTLMVLTLKVISCAFNYNDGLLKEEGLREDQKKKLLIKLPSLIEYIGYCLCCGTHFAGTVYEMKDYLDWAEEKGYQDEPLNRLMYTRPNLCDGEDMVELVRNYQNEFKEYYIQMQAAKWNQAPHPSQVKDYRIILDKTLADQVS